MNRIMVAKQSVRSNVLCEECRGVSVCDCEINDGVCDLAVVYVSVSGYAVVNWHQIKCVYYVKKLCTALICGSATSSDVMGVKVSHNYARLEYL